MPSINEKPSLIAANRDLDMFIARHIMKLSNTGWYRLKHNESDQYVQCAEDEIGSPHSLMAYHCLSYPGDIKEPQVCLIPKYSVRLRDAWEVVKKLGIRIEPKDWSDGTLRWYASCDAMTRHHHFVRLATQSEASAQHAIAILAVEHYQFTQREFNELED